MPEEVFLVFIASCIGLWLIQLVAEWIDRRRIKRGTVMKRYRGHLILVKAHQEPDTDDWRASIHVQFNEGTLTFSRRSATWSDFLLFNKDSLREARPQRR
jgi:hypothetical protein